MFQVMIVDDEKAIRENLPALINFEAHGFRVCGTAKNGQDALEKWESCRPDLIILDVRMPVMDGLEAARTIRGMEREDCRTIPIIAMSANAFDDDLKESVRSGMNGHLSKPVEVDKLYETLHAVIQGGR